MRTHYKIRTETLKKLLAVLDNRQFVSENGEDYNDTEVMDIKAALELEMSEQQETG